MSGFGDKAQWCRNVLANPQVRVSVGLRRSVHAQAEQMDPEAAEAALDRYAARYPGTWRRLEQTLAAALHTPDLNLPMLTLDLGSP